MGKERRRKRPPVEDMPLSGSQFPSSPHSGGMYSLKSDDWKTQTPNLMPVLDWDCLVSFCKVTAARKKIHKVVWKVATLTFALFSRLPLSSLLSSLLSGLIPFPALPRVGRIQLGVPRAPTVPRASQRVGLFFGSYRLVPSRVHFQLHLYLSASVSKKR